MLLKSLDTPEDLRRLEADKLPEVCKELRQKIIDELSRNPGHFGSSLGVVELTVALHYVFNTPYDRIVWDVGHQAYGHKILTGRRDTFCTNRKLHGLCPFPSPHESEYDTFTCGHASNSISAALGMAVAAKKNGENNRHVVAVIGDGSMSGGLAFEGLNNASSTPNNLLIILNDNNMALAGRRLYLLYDAQQGLFAYDHTGRIYRYSTILDHFEQVLHLGQLIQEEVILNKLCLDSDGTWWMGADKGLYKQEANHRIVAVLKGQYVNDIAFAGESLFVGTSNGVWQLSHALPDKKRQLLEGWNVQTLFYDKPNVQGLMQLVIRENV